MPEFINCTYQKIENPEYERGFKDGMHAAQQDLAFAAFKRGKLEQYNDAVGPDPLGAAKKAADDEVAELL